jgi:hypothetical protein
MTTQPQDDHAEDAAMMKVMLSTAEPVLDMNALPSAQRVYDAIVELRSAGMQACRETIANITGLKLSTVDDRLKHLHDFEKKIVRVNRGFYELIEVYPEARPSSMTVLANKYVKLEVGDDVLTLTPAEANSIAMAMAGFAHRAIVVEHTRQHLMIATDLALRITRLEQELKGYKALKHVNEAQKTLQLG